MIATLALSASLNLLTPAGREVAGTWAGPVANCYGVDASQCMPGYSWFTVDADGAYHGHTIARKPGQGCLSLDADGWTGQLYRLDRQTYLAVNTDGPAGYLIQLSRDRTHGSSTYLGPDAGVLESNHLYRTRLDPDKLLRLVEPYRCPNP